MMKTNSCTCSRDSAHQPYCVISQLARRGVIALSCEMHAALKPAHFNNHRCIRYYRVIIKTYIFYLSIF